MIHATFSYVFKDVDVTIVSRCVDVDDYAAKGLEIEFLDPTTGESLDDIPFCEDSFDELELYATEELLNVKEELGMDRYVY